MKKKARLILGGGAAYGLAHIGAMAALESEYEFTGIVGTSMGAIVGALYSIGYEPAQMLELARDFRTAELFNPLNLDFTRSGIFDGNMTLKRFLKWTDERKIEEGRIPFVAVAYDLMQKRSVLIDKGRFADAMRASSSLPYIYRPFPYSGYLFLDGGVEHPLPLAFANEVPGDITIAVNVLPHASIEAERIRLGQSKSCPRFSIAQVGVQSLLQNQAFIAIQEMLDYKPDIYIDAHHPQLSMTDLNKAGDFYLYGLRAAVKAMQDHVDSSFIEQLRQRYQKMLSRVMGPLERFKLG